MTSRVACSALLALSLVVPPSVRGGRIPSPFAAPLRPYEHAEGEIEVRRQVMMSARDGVRLALDLYLPPGPDKRPTILTRTPYGKERTDSLLLSLARFGYAVVAQDCRGTGASEPGQWDMYVYEKEDGADTLDWVKRQPWYDGTIGAVGGSYVGETQWFLSFHPDMTAILPEVAGIGKGRSNGVRLHLFVSAYAKSVGKAGGKPKAAGTEAVERETKTETWASGYFNDPLEAPSPKHLLERVPALRALAEAERGPRLLSLYAGMLAAERAALLRFLTGAPQVDYGNLGALPPVFGPEGSGPALKYVAASTADVYQRLHAPALMINGWYDWGLTWTLDTWDLLGRHAPAHVRDHTRLVLTPSAHMDLGYREGADASPDLRSRYRGKDNLPLTLRWFDHWLRKREDALRGLPRVSYFLMGANEWRGADTWPPPDVRTVRLFLDSAGNANGVDGGGTLSESPARLGRPDRYVYDPADPPPTTGGSIVSFLIPAGSIDQSPVQRRRDVLVYSTAPLSRGLAVVGPLTLVLYASSSAVDTDFSAKLSDVFPDGRALLLQSGMVRARFRDPGQRASLIEPGRLYRYEIDLWATANLFRPGHRVRVQVASADFPRYERNTNRGGRPGPPLKASQTVFHDSERPSHLVLSVLPEEAAP